MRDTAPQNIHRTVKALEAKGVLKAVKGVKGEVTLFHSLGTEGDNYVVDCDPSEWFGRQ